MHRTLRVGKHPFYRLLSARLPCSPVVLPERISALFFFYPPCKVPLMCRHSEGSPHLRNRISFPMSERTAFVSSLYPISIQDLSRHMDFPDLLIVLGLLYHLSGQIEWLLSSLLFQDYPSPQRMNPDISFVHLLNVLSRHVETSCLFFRPEL